MNNNFMQMLIRHIDDKDQVKQLLENNPNARQCINEKDEHGDTLLHFASRNHNIEVMTVLLEFGADPEAVNEHGRRPIHEVIDSFPCVQFLVEKYHIDVDAMKRGDWTPVMIAAMKGNLDIVSLLTESGALLNRQTKDGRTALYLAVQEGHVELSKYLTDQYPAAITQATNSGRFPTQAAAALTTCGAFEITQYLLSHAMIPLPNLLAHRDNSGRNILLDSAVSQSLELLKFLLDQGADANDADSLGRNMIHHAAMMGHLNVLKMLNNSTEGLNWDAQDAWDFWTPLMHAAREGHLDIVKYLIETIQVDPNIKDKQNRLAQDLASLWNHDSIVNYLTL